MVFVALALLVATSGLSQEASAQEAPRTDPSVQARAYYDDLLSDGRLDLTVALGYEQVKTDVHTPVIGDILNVFAGLQRDDRNTARDIALMERAFLGCSECGFRESSRRAGLRVYESSLSYLGREIRVRLRFLSAERGSSVSWLRAQFIDALRHDDAILYLGHGRNGRGFPDFAGPTGDTGKIFYFDEVQGWVGFERGYFHPTKLQILGLVACRTSEYFRTPLRERVWEKPPEKLGLVLSDDNTWFEDYPGVAAAFVRGLLLTRDRTEILGDLERSATYYGSLHLGEEHPRPLFIGDGFFDSTYRGRMAPRRHEPSEPWSGGMPF